MQPDRLDPRLRRVVDALESLDDRLLVLLFVKKSEPAEEVAEMLGVARPEVLSALGRLAQARLVGHQRPEDGGPTHWFMTRDGNVRGEQLFRATAARLVADAQPTVPEEPEPESGEAAPDAQKLKARRRVPIDQNERGGFSWDT